MVLRRPSNARQTPRRPKNTPSVLYPSRRAGRLIRLRIVSLTLLGPDPPLLPERRRTMLRCYVLLGCSLLRRNAAEGELVAFAKIKRLVLDVHSLVRPATVIIGEFRGFRVGGAQIRATPYRGWRGDNGDLCGGQANDVRVLARWNHLGGCLGDYQEGSAGKESRFHHPNSIGLRHDREAASCGSS